MTHIPDIRPITSIFYWANRFGETCTDDQPGYPGHDTVDQLVADLYPRNNTDACETAHVVTLDGVLGILTEYEFSDGYVPDPAVCAHWRMVAPEGCRFLAYTGHGSFDDCWQLAAFIPAEGATRELVEQCGAAMFEWGPKA